MHKIKVYLCARISKDAHAWNEKVSNSLSTPTSVFMPHKHNPWNLKHEDFPKEVYEMDLGAMKESHICLVLPPYGRDCAWEIGWYSNSDKPIIVFTEKETEWLRDWMIKGGITYIVASSPKTFAKLKNDPLLGFKEIFFINNLGQLNDLIIKIYGKHYE